MPPRFRFHYGPVSGCGSKFEFCAIWGWPAFVFQWKNRGYYAGWFPDDFWQRQVEQGNVGPNKPWRLW